MYIKTFFFLLVLNSCQSSKSKTFELPHLKDDIQRIQIDDSDEDAFLEDESAYFLGPMLSVAADNYTNMEKNSEIDALTNDERNELSNDPEDMTPEERKEDAAKKQAEARKAEEEFLQPLSLEFKGATLREVIRTISEETHINFIIPDRVSNERIYINLKNVAWDEALHAILDTNGLGMVKLGGDVVRIDTLEVLNKEKSDADDLRKKVALVTPTKVMVVRLSYSKAANMVKMVTNMLPSASFDKRVKVDSDDRTNSVIVEAIPQELSKIRSLIERLDLQTPQVRIESRVIEILKTTNNFLGINWGGPFNYDQGRGLGFGNLVFPNNLLSAFSIDSGATQSGRQDAKFDVHLGSLNNIAALDLRLRMGELTSQTRNLQNNNILVVDGEQAVIKAGTEDFFSIPAAGGNGATALSSVQYNLALTVTPHITADGAVQMVLTVENSSPTSSTSASAVGSRSTRSLTTNMIRKSGDTAVIGGLYTTSYVDTKQGIPFFQDIPIVGLLFQSSAKTESKRELIILITPTIVSGNERVVLAQRDKDFRKTNNALVENEKISIQNQQNVQSQSNSTGENANALENNSEFTTKLKDMGILKKDSK